MINILSVNFPLIGEAELIGIIVLAFLMYYLTRELFRIENIILYADIVFTIVWTAASTTSISQALGIPLIGFLGLIFYYLFLGFVGLSAVLALASYLMFIKKYLQFRELKNKYEKLENDYNNYANKYETINKNIRDVIKKSLNNINEEINDALEKLEDAKRTPERIILSDKISTEGELVPSNHNTVIIGLGGTGTALVTGVGERADREQESYLKSSILDNLISRNIIKSGNENFLFILYDTNVNNINTIRKKYRLDEVDSIYKNLIKTFNYANSWDQNHILSANPDLVGTNFTILQGTGNNRRLGAAAYKVIKDQFLNDVKNAISELINRRNTGETIIYVINSWGGGTGSGTFLNFTIDLKEKLNQIPALQARSPLIYGIGILPAPEEEAIFRANAYAALKEMTYILKPQEILLGDVRRVTVSNPFDAYFLLTRDETNIMRDYEISTGISNWIIDNSTTTKEEGNPLSYDPRDFKTRYQIYSGKSFASIEFYTIFYPASRLSWYKVIGVPMRKQLNEKFKSTSEEVFKTKEEISQLKNKLSALKRDSDALIDTISAFMSTEPYKSFINLTKKWQSETNRINSEIAPDGSKAINRLDSEVYNIETTSPEYPTSLPNISQKLNNFSNIIDSEGNFLKYPRQTSITYSIPVDPDKFTLPNENPSGDKISIGNLINPQMNMIRLIYDSGRQDDLRSAFNALQNPPGQAGSLIKLNFSLLNSPMNLTNDEINFIIETNPALRADNNNILTVRRPILKDIIVLASTNGEISSSQSFPNPDAFKQALMQSSQNVEYRLSKVNYRKYSISMYRVMLGIPIMYYSPEEEAMMPLINNYFEAYKRETTSYASYVFIHHTLFYDLSPTDLRTMGILINDRASAQDVRNAVTKFWIDYEPLIYDDYSAGLYSSLTFAKIFGLTKSLSELAGNNLFERISSLDPSYTGIPELNSINSKLSELSGILDRLNTRIDLLKESLQRINKIYQLSDENMRRIIDRMKEHINENYVSAIESMNALNNGLQGMLNKLSEVTKFYAENKRLAEQNTARRISDNLNLVLMKFKATVEKFQSDIVNIL
ncbi:MAG: tubulin-like doman-containing protein [Thermoplasmata archaeon]